MFRTLLIANRGEIAVRIARTAKRLGIRTVAVYSDADRDALHVASADEAYRLGPAPAAESYLNIPAILEAARRSGAEAVHPGYGFLSENPGFVEAVEAAGLVFVGPPASAIRAMGLKDAAKRAMVAAGVPVVPGYHGEDQDDGLLAHEAERIGYPVLIKAAAGGGGKGMRRVDEPQGFQAALAGARREAASAFGDDRVLVERYVTKPRHVEIQVFADGHGNAVHLFERDCSLQRRHQKVIEEAPAPGMTAEMRAAMGAAAVKAALAIGYRGAGTVEFIADASEGLRPDRFFFMEMNTRLQVEHPVTEAIAGVDLVEWQLRVAAGEPLPVDQDGLAIDGHAVEARVYAEDPAKGFLPQTGRLTALAFPPGVRVDTGVRAGDAVTPFYDPMIAKVIAHGATRREAIERLRTALTAAEAAGCTTNLRFLARLLADPDFVAGDVDTGLIERRLGALTGEEAAPPEAVAVAAVAALGHDAAPAGADPFDALSGFRLWGPAADHLRLRQGETSFDVTVNGRGGRRYGVTADGGAVDLTLLAAEAGTVRADFGGRVATFRVTRDGAEVRVSQGGADWRFTVDDGLAGEDDDTAGADSVRAPMPGLVTAVFVAPGQEVKRGDPLVVTEAMKMEHTLTAGRDGRVAAVSVSVGERVSEGAVLVTLEQADG